MTQKVFGYVFGLITLFFLGLISRKSSGDSDKVKQEVASINNQINSNSQAMNIEAQDRQRLEEKAKEDGNVKDTIDGILDQLNNNK